MTEDRVRSSSTACRLSAPPPPNSVRTRRRAESESHEFACLKAHGELRSPARVKGFHSAPQSASAPPTPTLLFGFSFCR